MKGSFVFYYTERADRCQENLSGPLEYNEGMTPKKLQELLDKARAELALLYEIGNALRTTLDLDETLYIILTGVTAHVGLAFNRAAIFLADKKENVLRGKMGIGPETGEEAQAIWGEIQNRRMGLPDLISNYRLGQPLENSPFHRMIQQLKVPLSERAGGLLASAVLEGTPLEIVDPQAQAKAEQDPVLRFLNSTCCVLVPLKGSDGQVVGIIFADNRITLKPITRESFRLMALLAAHAGLAIENARLYQAARQQANLDSLTQLWNKGAFKRFLMETMAAAEKHHQAMSLLLLDLDYFKGYNDRFGHLEGDQALIRVAKMLMETARAGDYVARYGGEEFVLILPNPRKLNALKLAERIRVSMEITGLPITLSAGVATFPDDAQDSESLLNAADKALYSAKNLGRNRVVIA